jgi:hypothetical protein
MFTTSNKKPDPRAPIGSRRLAGFVFTPGRKCHHFRGGARKHSEIGASDGGYAQREKLSIGWTRSSASARHIPRHYVNNARLNARHFNQ